MRVHRAGVFHLGGELLLDLGSGLLGAEAFALIRLDGFGVPIIPTGDRQVGGRQDLLVLPRVDRAWRTAVTLAEILIAQ